MTAAELAKALGGKRVGDQWVALCVAHKEKTPSLYLKDDAGKVLVHCHGGCSQEAVIEALRAKGLWAGKSGNNGLPPGIPSAASQVWAYRDSTGRVLGYTARFEGPDGKTFRPFFKRDGDRWRAGGAEKPLPLYGLDRLAANPDAVVIVTEGEKAADAAERHLQTRESNEQEIRSSDVAGGLEVSA